MVVVVVVVMMIAPTLGIIPADVIIKMGW